MRINKELLKGSTVILILSLLQQRSMYGYEMIKQIDHESDGVFEFNEGTLYPILHSLESEGMIESYWSEGQGRKRKYYRITEQGTLQLKEKRQEWIRYRTGIERIIGMEGV